MQIDAKNAKMQKALKAQKYKNKKLSSASYQIKNEKTQKEQNIQKEQKIKIALACQLLVLRKFKMNSLSNSWTHDVPEEIVVHFQNSANLSVNLCSSSL